MSVRNKLLPFDVIFLASVIAGCASSVDELPGVKYYGMADGVGGNCLPFEFKIAIHEGTITGQASTRYGHAIQLWNIAGFVYPNGHLTMSAETTDRRISDPHAYWEGKLTEDGADIWQPFSKWCNLPRSGKLTRR